MQTHSYFNKSLVIGIVSCLIIMSCRKEKLAIQGNKSASLSESSAPDNNDTRIFESVILKTETKNTGYSFRFKQTKDKIKSISKIKLEIEINNEWYSLSSELKKSEASTFKIAAGETISELLTDGKTYTLFVTCYNSSGKQIGNTETFNVEAKEKRIKIKDHMVWSQGHDTKTISNYGHIRVYFSLPRPKAYYEQLLKSGSMMLTFNGELKYRKSGKSVDVSLKFMVDNLQENDHGQIYTDINFQDPTEWANGNLEGTLSLYETDDDLEDEKTISESDISKYLYDKNESPDLLSTKIYSFDKGTTWTLEMTIADRGGWGDSVIWEFDKPINSKVGLTYSGDDKYGNEIFKTTINSKSDNIKFDPGTIYSYTTVVLRLGIGTRTSTGQANNKAELL